MNCRVTDDGSVQSVAGVQSGRVRVPRRAWAYGRLFVFFSTLATLPATYAQQEFQAEVRKVESGREWLHVAVNKSIVIETNKPIKTVQTASPEIANVVSISPTQVLVQGVSFGRTQIIVWSEDNQQQLFDVSVELELDLLLEAIKQVDPLSQVTAYPIMETVVLNGTVSDAGVADQIMQIAGIFASDVQNHLKVAGEQQVLLRVIVAEVSRSALRQLGVNGMLIGENVRDFPVVSNIGQFNPSSFGFGGGNVRGNLPLNTDGTAVASDTTLSFAFPRVQLQVFLRALHENGLLRVLAEPNLVTLSGRTAAFLAGGEFPIPVPQTTGGGGTTTITIEFREFGVRLAFTPVVLSNQQIRLNVAPEVSQLDFAQGVSFGGFVVPGLNSRRAETTVEMGSGESLAIAGLLSENIRAVTSRLPGIGELPVLGALFSSTEYRKNLTELVIIITPEIVSPVEYAELGDYPGQHMQDPDWWQLYALGMMETPPLGSETYPTPAREEQASMEDLEPMTDDAILGPWGQSENDETN